MMIALCVMVLAWLDPSFDVTTGDGLVAWALDASSGELPELKLELVVLE